MNALDFPEYLARVKAVRYREGSHETGDLADPEFAIIGHVIGTPRSGSDWLTIKTDDVVPGRKDYDPANPGAWSISDQYIHLSIAACWNWTFEPAPPQAAVLAIVIDQRGVAPEVIAAHVRMTLLNLACEVIPHMWEPDLDTVAECAGVPSATLIDLTA